MFLVMVMLLMIMPSSSRSLSPTPPLSPFLVLSLAHTRTHTHTHTRTRGTGLSPHLGVVPREEALLKPAVHGERDEEQLPLVSEVTEGGQEGAAEGLLAPPELASVVPVDVLQKHGHHDHGQDPHACGGQRHTCGVFYDSPELPLNAM